MTIAIDNIQQLINLANSIKHKSAASQREYFIQAQALASAIECYDANLVFQALIEGGIDVVKERFDNLTPLQRALASKRPTAMVVYLLFLAGAYDPASNYSLFNELLGFLDNIFKLDVQMVASVLKASHLLTPFQLKFSVDFVRSIDQPNIACEKICELLEAAHILSLLFYHIERNHEHKIKKFLNSNMVKYINYEYKNKPPLEHAIDCGHINTIWLLMEKGALAANCDFAYLLEAIKLNDLKYVSHFLENFSISLEGLLFVIDFAKYASKIDFNKYEAAIIVKLLQNKYETDLALKEKKKAIVANGALYKLNNRKKTKQSVSNAIASSLYAEEKSISKKLHRDLKAIYLHSQYHVLARVLEVAALGALGKHTENPDKRLKVIMNSLVNLSDLKINTDGVEGLYTLKNSVFIAGRYNKESSLSIALHEVMHFVAEQVYNNRCNPYGNDVDRENFANAILGLNKYLLELKETAQDKFILTVIDTLMYPEREDNKVNRTEYSEYIAVIAEVIGHFCDKYGIRKGMQEVDLWFTKHANGLWKYFNSNFNRACEKYIMEHNIATANNPYRLYSKVVKSNPLSTSSGLISTNSRCGMPT